MKNEQQDGIASFFEKYPDVPKEVILKEDILRLGMHFTEPALEAAEGFREKVYFQFAWDRAAAEGNDDQQRKRVPNEVMFKKGPWDLKKIITRVPINPKSPYLIDVVDGKVSLVENGAPIAEVEYPVRPKYYDMKFPDGTLYRDIAPISDGGGSLFVQVYAACQFWGSKDECKFCDINPNSPAEAERRFHPGRDLEGGVRCRSSSGGV